RKQLEAAAETNNIRVLFPSLKFCTDNAAMIGCCAAEHLNRGHTSSLNLGVESRLGLDRVMELYQ
ncbi:MAG: tRNA (adenosine(37)-N6)-threonylcarbamoyltransferase complex transferase subunit TsaD, partial [Cyanobacteriota bacterium]|nr:tRNA (adenosine(37)-N6)-threonylcarbamoyltransferase complex transferase subunit TsaD [Cyanobacteriota bacterium]